MPYSADPLVHHPARTSQTAAGQPTGLLRVATYNVHSCVGSDRRCDPSRVADVLRELDADVLALQEVDAQHRVGGYLDQWTYLADATGYDCVPGISLRTHRKTFGNALLTRVPLIETRLHDVSIVRREPRGAIEATLSLAGRTLRLFATHFGLRHHERQAQSARLCTLLSQAGAEGSVLLGDLNEWRRHAGGIAGLLECFVSADALATFPSRWPVVALDRIVATRHLDVVERTVHRSALARRASDHLPVVATLRWAAA